MALISTCTPHNVSLSTLYWGKNEGASMLMICVSGERHVVWTWLGTCGTHCIVPWIPPVHGSDGYASLPGPSEFYNGLQLSSVSCRDQHGPVGWISAGTCKISKQITAACVKTPVWVGGCIGEACMGDGRLYCCLQHCICTHRLKVFLVDGTPVTVFTLCFS